METPERYYPDSLAVMMTNQCQPGHCRHCIANASPEGSDTLHASHIFSAIDEAHATDFCQVYFCGGEPTLHPGLFEAVRYALYKNMFPVIETNGVWGNDEKSAQQWLKQWETFDLWKNIPISVSLSLDEFHCPGIPLDSILNIATAFLKGHGINVNLHVHSMNAPRTREIHQNFFDGLCSRGFKIFVKESSQWEGDRNKNKKTEICTIESEETIPADTNIWTAATTLFTQGILAEVKDWEECRTLRELMEVIHQDENFAVALDQSNYVILRLGPRKINFGISNVTLSGRGGKLKSDENFMNFYRQTYKPLGRSGYSNLLCVGPDGKFYANPGHYGVGLEDFGEIEEVPIGAVIARVNTDPIAYTLVFGINQEIMHILEQEDSDFAEKIKEPGRGEAEAIFDLIRRPDLVAAIRRAT